MQINDSLRKIILMGRAANIHIIMALQRPETSVLDGAIRNNYPVRISLEEISRWEFQDGILVSQRWFNNS